MYIYIYICLPSLAAKKSNKSLALTYFLSVYYGPSVTVAMYVHIELYHNGLRHIEGIHIELFHTERLHIDLLHIETSHRAASPREAS